jgi:hypothetical protein
MDAGSDGRPTPAEWNAPTKTIAEGTSIMQPVRLGACVDGACGLCVCVCV